MRGPEIKWKLGPKQIERILKLRADGLTQIEIARAMGVTGGCISRILKKVKAGEL